MDMTSDIRNGGWPRSCKFVLIDISPSSVLLWGRRGRVEFLIDQEGA